jgi:hypothetical protein
MTAADTAAAKTTTNLVHHFLPVHFGANSHGAVRQTIQYPEDLGYGGGHVLTQVTEHNV